MPATVKAVRVHEYGGPEAVHIDEIEVGDPGPGEVRVRHTAIGVNFADVHGRTGRYPFPALPHTLGAEAAGVVEAVGPGVDYLREGDRIVYSSGGPTLPRGAYCEARVLAADRLILLPDEIDDATAAAMSTKGLTAHYLIHDVYPVRAGDTIVVHAAAGGVGQILCQWADYKGARVIGVVGSPEKAEVARAHGCHHPLVRGTDDIPRRVRALTAGEGVPVVFDSVGAATFEDSLACLRPKGLLASFGSASGPVPPLDLFRLNQMGSLYVTSAAFHIHLANREEVLARAGDLISMVVSGAIRIDVARRYPLAEAGQALIDIESGATTGMSVLIP
jgi:NADPH2:quinone reductase